MRLSSPSYKLPIFLLVQAENGSPKKKPAIVHQALLDLLVTSGKLLWAEQKMNLQWDISYRCVKGVMWKCEKITY
jgi:hypothetical protein